MAKNEYFRDALKNFTHTAASGGAIAHLADLGYAPREIEAMLDFPTPYREIQETFWNHLLEKRVIVEEKSELGKRQEKVRFVTDYNAYGGKSFRKVVEYEEGAEDQPDPGAFLPIRYNRAAYGEFPAFLEEYCGENAYVSCDFGRQDKAFFEPLNEKQHLYMEGVPWRRKTVWHRLDGRMREILAVLYGKSGYHGIILLLEKKEQVIF
jgi:hypothetical protein